jgi:hypothetical protein
MMELATTIRRPGIIVALLSNSTAISTASRGKCQLILILETVPGKVTRLATLVAESTVRTWCMSSRCWSYRPELPRWWRRQTRCSIRGPVHWSIGTVHTLRDPDAMAFGRRCIRGGE